MQIQEGLTFEKVWAMFQETGLRFKETDRQFKEIHLEFKEIAQRFKETDKQFKETDKQLKETDRKISKLGGRFGEMIEYMVMPNLLDKFQVLGFVFTKAYQQAVLKDKNKQFITEIDITLENGEKVMIVEVKSKPSTEDISEHAERMKKFRAHADLHNDKRIFLGAIAGMVFNENEKIFAMKNGFYVIEPSGKTFVITSPGGQLKEW